MVFRASSWVTKKVEFFIFRQVLFMRSGFHFMRSVFLFVFSVRGGHRGSCVFWGSEGLFSPKREAFRIKTRIRVLGEGSFKFSTLVKVFPTSLLFSDLGEVPRSGKSSSVGKTSPWVENLKNPPPSIRNYYFCPQVPESRFLRCFFYSPHAQGG